MSCVTDKAASYRLLFSATTPSIAPDIIFAVLIIAFALAALVFDLLYAK